MAIPNGVIFIWTGTNSNIPAGWVRETSLDGKFVKGHLDGSTNPNLTGGSATHTHTGSSHTHSMQSHTHTVFVGGAIGTNIDAGGADQNGIVNYHTHPAVTSSGPTSVSVSTVTVTYASVSNNPPYYEVIFIKPQTSVGGLPDLAIGLTDDSSFQNNTGKYNGYYNCDGNNSTPNLSYKYLRGAGTGANAGGTGGSTTNVHGLTHSHSVTHGHTASIGASDGERNNDTGGCDMASRFHTHSGTIYSSTVSSSDTPTTTTSEVVEPAYKALLSIQNRSGTPYTPVGIIGMWLGALSSIPGNFELVTSMYDKHLKIGGIVGDIGVTGGSNTHSHLASSHTHAGISHSHTGVSDTHSCSTRHESNAQGGVQNHYHNLSTDTVNLVLDSATTTADSSNNEPEYRTVAFIKYKGEKGGAFLFNLLR